MVAKLLILVIGTPLFALVFSLVCMFLGLFSEDFKPTAEGGFLQFYKQFLIVSGVYCLLAVIGLGGILGLAVMALAYKTVFGADWKHAIIIGILGGIIGWIAMAVILVALGMAGVPMG